MNVVQHINSVFTSNTYIIDNDTDKVYVIDPGDYENIIKFQKSTGKTLEGVLLTHVHYDHIYGLPKLLEINPQLPIFTSTNGVEALESPKINFSRYHEDDVSIKSANIKIVADNDNIELWPGVIASVISTPGHNYSSISFVIEDFIFTGDSYIPGVKVVSSLPRSNKEEAIKNELKLIELAKSSNLFVAPGHGNIQAPEGKSIEVIFF